MIKLCRNKGRKKMKNNALLNKNGGNNNANLETVLN